jgi:hypothetical protein
MLSCLETGGSGTASNAQVGIFRRLSALILLIHISGSG